MAVDRMKTSEDVHALARELGVTRRCLYKRRTKLEAVEPGEEASRLELPLSEDKFIMPREDRYIMPCHRKSMALCHYKYIPRNST